MTREGVAMATSLADVAHASQPRTRARAETGLVRSRRRMMDAHEELELAVEIFHELAECHELERAVVAKRLLGLEGVLGVLEDAQRTLEEAIRAPSGRSGR
jgi:hypothetical protein